MSRRLKPIIVDPGLYLSQKTEMFYAAQKRVLPNAYRFFFGILSRNFIEFCVVGTDNLPRTVLMYFSNTLQPFPTTSLPFFATPISSIKLS
ncbi:Core-2/I-branching beta-1,6-N-acetylglucosaminyltransferase family protein [Prunus dulcis]|uniref:Core-2/I-branching beta-1,6-N-acetylglucosaminyltransferase family protein n=1 Tax=Prunus dulcis TaxID=3755 RepID=A0A4Y1QLB8_PRUDU|nr:Core-2/I-branching beta-1,6-N-acetylglucosaminyltransferase family protein [Prunus dulcis]